MEFEDLITDLKVISMLKNNGRLCMRNGQLSIEPSIESKQNILITWGAYTSLALRRWWNQDNRQNALLKLQSVILKCHETNEKIATDKREEFVQLCGEAANGLLFLKHTYMYDAAVSARLSVYIDTLKKIFI
tara:strand:- start:5154 stop:5549 length:396 start_codon:yes stop_codon:yes gene_type:complete